MNSVEGISNLGRPRPEAPLAWCKQTVRGLGLIRIHWARESHLTACGMLNLETSPYVAPGYAPLHVAYATDGAAIAAARRGVLFANKTRRESAVCKLCERASDSFRALVEANET